MGDVDDEGNYSTTIESEGKRFAMHIACLSGGRVTISRLAIDQAILCLSIALRYGLARKQFGNPEKQLMDYPLH
jgi:acyl-CoA oxidase